MSYPYSPRKLRKSSSLIARPLGGQGSSHGAVRVMMLAAAGLGLACKARGQTVSTWLGGTGDWNTASNWSPNGVPNNSSIDVFIDGGNPTNSAVALNGAATIGALTLDAGDQIALGSVSQLMLTRDS